jgi:hypothetical protein
MFLRKNKSTNDKVNFKVISQDHAKPDDIKFKVKIISEEEIKIVPIKELFYQDKWLSGFSLDDVRMIAKLYAQAEWYRDKAQIAKMKETVESV